MLWLVLGSVITATAPAFASDMGEVAAQLVTQQSYRHILDDMLYTHDGHNRGFGAEHDLAMANITLLMSSFGLEVTLEPFEYEGVIHYNVVGTKWGTLDPSKEYIVGAHYDSFGNAGADDDASGVALVLEIARALTGQVSDYTIRFIAFDREERGLVGSWAYALDHMADDIQGMIAADMVAWNRGGDVVDIHAAAASASFANALATAVSLYGDGLGYQLAGPSGASDHAPFQAIGVEACLLIEDWGNPCWHQMCDSVDHVDYIDYAYAVKSVRSVVGFLVDHAGITIELPDADFDGDGDVDAEDFAAFELCLEEAGTPPQPPCDFFDLDADGDVDCPDGTLLTNAWTGPDVPPTIWACMPLPPRAEGQSGRALAVTPPQHGNPMALLVTGTPDDPAVSCMSLYVQPDGQLATTPVFQTYDTWQTVIVSGEEIVPGTSYRVWCDYGDQGGAALSPIGMEASTVMWGDVVGAFYNGRWTPVNGTVDFNDILAIVEAFRHLPTSPPLSTVDLVGSSGSACAPDEVVDFLDIAADVEAFKGFSYWETTSCLAPCE